MQDDWTDWLGRNAHKQNRAYRDVYECVLRNELTLRETFEYVRNAARAHNQLAKRNPGGFGAINRVWASQYRDIALHLLHHLRKDA